MSRLSRPLHPRFLHESQSKTLFALIITSDVKPDHQRSARETGSTDSAEAPPYAIVTRDQL